MKTCTQCGKTKPLNEFHKFNRGRDGHRSQCRTCIGKYQRDWRAGKADVGEITLVCQYESCSRTFTYVKTTGIRRFYCSERCRMQASGAAAIARAAKYIRQCACGSTDVARVGKPVCPKCHKDPRNPILERAKTRRRTLRLYNITQERFDQMLAKQGGRCAICRTNSPGKRGWFIDHNHDCCPGKGSCGKCVRELLCLNCNLMVGFALDNPKVLAHAARYVRQHRKSLIA